MKDRLDRRSLRHAKGHLGHKCSISRDDSRHLDRIYMEYDRSYIAMLGII